ncbi:hypothetical protein HOP50_16g78580 [Chloropicon primus]|nr:hypothetical protein A3770_16p78280 [Chloropicon primus]UPR04516.1 hypothetical protein HOP50_16g78580 [Chloropicon primus]|eukprot:QDZ25310.1 hypothetical protein A3770_16p78280 [Chloropicon primus]
MSDARTAMFENEVRLSLYASPPQLGAEPRPPKRLVFLRLFKGKDSFQCDLENLFGNDIEAQYYAEILHDYERLSVDRAEDLGPNDNVDVLAFSIHSHSVKEVMKLIRKHKPSVLIVNSDEHGNLPKYEKLFPFVRLVYRQYRYKTGTRGYRNPPNQRIMPIGYHCWDEKAKSDKPLSERKYVWSFIGTIATDENINRIRLINLVARFVMGAYRKQIQRYEMVRELSKSGLDPHFAGSTLATSPEERAEKNFEVFRESKFVVCPRGNSNIDTSRTYTASKTGGIPVVIVPREDWDEFYAHMDIEPPWPRADDTAGAVRIMRNLTEGPAERLNQMQRDVLHWWDALNVEIRKNIDESVNYCRDFWQRAKELGVPTQDMLCRPPPS